MQVKQVTKCQYFVTITESELLIVQGYSQIFNLTEQAAALIMFVNGWNSYAKKMSEYNRNCRLEPTSSSAAKLIDIDHLLNTHSDEAISYRKQIAKALLLPKESDDGNSDSVSSSAK